MGYGTGVTFRQQHLPPPSSPKAQMARYFAHNDFFDGLLFYMLGILSLQASCQIVTHLVNKFDQRIKGIFRIYYIPNYYNLTILYCEALSELFLDSYMRNMTREVVEIL